MTTRGRVRRGARLEALANERGEELSEVIAERARLETEFSDQQAQIFYQWEHICIRKAQEWPKLNLDECLELMREVFANYKNKRLGLA